MSEEQDFNTMNATPQENHVTFHYIKNNLFRVIHADGAWGGITPRLGIHMALYSERNPIPQQMTYQITGETKLGEEIREARVAREGIVREVEAEVIMDVGTARALVEWLQERIKTIEQAQEKIRSRAENS